MISIEIDLELLFCLCIGIFCISTILTITYYALFSSEFFTDATASEIKIKTYCVSNVIIIILISEVCLYTYVLIKIIDFGTFIEHTLLDCVLWSYCVFKIVKATVKLLWKVTQKIASKNN